MAYPETIPRVTAVEHLGGYRLRLTFDDGLVRDLDFEGRLQGEVFEPLHARSYFAQARIDEEQGTVAWPNEVDLDPVVLHGDEEPLGEPLFSVVGESESRRSVVQVLAPNWLKRRVSRAPSPLTIPAMPRISAFYGIVISMNWSEHPPPHFHVSYAEHGAKIDIRTLDVIAGRLPARALRMVREWAGAHRGELEANWERASARIPLASITPLK